MKINRGLTGYKGDKGGKEDKGPIRVPVLIVWVFFRTNSTNSTNSTNTTMDDGITVVVVNWCVILCVIM